MLNQLNTTTKRELDSKFIDGSELADQFDGTLITASGSSLTIDSANVPASNLSMSFTYSQSGTGTPSPTNKRDIIGFDKLEVVSTQGESTKKSNNNT